MVAVLRLSWNTSYALNTLMKVHNHLRNLVACTLDNKGLGLITAQPYHSNCPSRV